MSVLIKKIIIYTTVCWKNKADSFIKPGGLTMINKRRYLLAVVVIFMIISALLSYKIYRESFYNNTENVIIVKDKSKVEPGFGLTDLHKRGYTGKGINVAVIDSLIVEEHEEFNGRLIHYEKVGKVTEIRHGTHVASVLNDYLNQNKMTKEDLIEERRIRDQENGYVTLYIPAVGRYVASIEDEDGYIYDHGGGLSFATPVLTGLAALTAQINPELTNEKVLDLLKQAIVINEEGLDVINPHLLADLAEKTLNQLKVE